MKQQSLLSCNYGGFLNINKTPCIKSAEVPALGKGTVAFLVYITIHLFPNDATAPSAPGPPQYRDCTITLLMYSIRQSAFRYYLCSNLQTGWLIMGTFVQV
jgi:hypothetical protein